MFSEQRWVTIQRRYNFGTKRFRPSVTKRKWSCFNSTNELYIFSCRQLKIHLIRPRQEETSSRLSRFICTIARAAVSCTGTGNRFFVWIGQKICHMMLDMKIIDFMCLWSCACNSAYELGQLVVLRSVKAIDVVPLKELAVHWNVVRNRSRIAQSPLYRGLNI